MTVNPPDAIVAARSFPRRWRELVQRADDEGPDVVARSGALDLAAEAADVLAATADALPANIPARSAGSGPPLDRLDAAAGWLADAADSVPAGRWDGEPAAALSSGIERASELLRRAEDAVDDAAR